MARKIAAGNWKMNGLTANLDEAAAIGKAAGATEVVLCPPATLLAQANWKLQQTPVKLGGQDCHANVSGAHTGDISAAMLADAGATYVILGHSERRADHGESDKDVHAKVKAAWDAGLVAIICVGETEAQRDAGQTLSVISGQIADSVPAGATAENTVVAYEPVWAIGTGRTATPLEIDEVHSAIRSQLVQIHGATAADISLLYGGSVKAANAAEIFAVKDVDGALVGGASLTAADFVPIMQALAAS